MFSVFKKSQGIINDIDAFFDAIDQGALVYEEGIAHYVNKQRERFELSYRKIRELKNNADKYKLQSTSILYTHSLLPDFRGDILRLLENMNDLIDMMKHNIIQFDEELPEFPDEIKTDMIDLAHLSSKSVQEVVQAARTFFRQPLEVRDVIIRVNHYEDEADVLSESIKRRIFQEIPSLDLSQKIHLRYFVFNIETISDMAEAIGEILGIMAIKRFS